MELLRKLVLVVFIIIFCLSPYIYGHYFINMELRNGFCGNFVVLDKIMGDEIIHFGGDFIMSVTWPYLEIENTTGRIFVLKILPEGIIKYNALEIDEQILVCREGENFKFSKLEYM